MSDKDPLFWASLWQALSLPIPWQGALMASVIATLRALYDGTDLRAFRILLEALLCGALSLSAASLIEYMAWPAGLAIAIGGGIGFLGVGSVRELLLRWSGRHLDK